MIDVYRRPLSALILASILAMAGTAAAEASPNTSPGPECLFDWLEKQHPQRYAPSGTPSRSTTTAYYRSYTAGTGAYLAVANGRLFAAPGQGNAATDIGPLDKWLADAGCPADKAAPEIVYTSRSHDAGDVAVNAPVVAAFSEPVELPATASSVLVVRGADGAAVPGSVTYDPAQPALIFRPRTALSPDRRYVAAVSPSVRDLAGNRLEREYRWSFTTGRRRDTEKEQQLQILLDRATHRFAIPGSIMAVRYPDGRTWTSTSGYSSLTDCSPITTDMRFRVGSNTKTYVATIILQMADKGLIDLEAPIGRYLADEWKAYLPAYDADKIKVHNLLNHTSGVFNFTTDPAWGEAFVSGPEKLYFPQELLQIANRNAAKAPPLGKFSYSNTNYILLGLLIRKAGGLTYSDAVRRLASSLRLADTYAPPIGDGELPAPASRGYWEDPETAILRDVTRKDPSTVWSSGDVVATITDLAAWGAALGTGKLLSPKLQAQRLTYVDMNDHLQYGLGIVRDRRFNLIGHQGGMIGYTSQVYYLPEQDTTFALFFNRTLPLHDYSDVLTLDALQILWPDSAAARAVASATRAAPREARSFCMPVH